MLQSLALCLIFFSIADFLQKLFHTPEKRDLSIITSLKLYKIIKDRLSSIKEDENLILFIPFPIVLDFKDSIFLPLMNDYLQAIYNQLERENLIHGRGFYYIYPSMEADIYVLRNGKGFREYIKNYDLHKFIVYQSTIN